ncbi:hypothetical protein [Brevundimonas denitrificans]|uniref:hypothetical protein n=1 Tax=Brevundimonas denitrificans TaxID=1443434 RepID=UPI00223ACC7D|nr:hypothetical protein [Brevundimonas denitrificans]
MSFPYFARIVLLAFVTVFASAAQAQAQAQEPECADLHPDWSIEGETPTTVSAKDLVLLRDFGAVYPLAAQSPFGVSPDGQRIAIQLRQARPSSNTYCLGLFVIDRHADEPPALIDDGGDLVFPRPNHQGLGSFPVGHQQVIVPRWSPNGQSVAYLKREDGSTQVYVVSGDGSGGRFVTSSETDVEEFVWSPDGQEVIYATPAELVAAEAAILEEGRRGWRYDGRFHPLTQSRPYPAPIASEYRAAHLRTGAERPATEEEARRLNAETRSGRVVNSRENPVVWNHGIAWGGRLDQEVRLSPYRLQFRSGSGEDIICEFEACRSGAVGLWPSEDGRELYYLRREGPASSRFALYRFLSPHDEPQKIFETEDALSGCQMVAADLICGRETSLSPRSLVAIEPNSGRSTVLFDPNPEFRQRRLSRPTRLYWTNDAGEDAFGDLILPPDHREGTDIRWSSSDIHPLDFCEEEPETSIRSRR